MRRPWFLLPALMATVVAARDGSASVAALPSFTDVAKSVSPAVVNIAITAQVGPSSPGQGGQGGDPFFDRFFGGQSPRTAQSLGSGFVLTADGYIAHQQARRRRERPREGRGWPTRRSTRPRSSDATRRPTSR